MASCWPWEQTQATCRAETPRSSFPQDPPAISDGEELIDTPWGVLCAMSPRAPGRAESRLSTGVTPPSTKLSRLSSLLCLTSSRPQLTSRGHPQINTCPPVSGKAPGLVSEAIRLCVARRLLCSLPFLRQRRPEAVQGDVRRREHTRLH